MYLNGPEYSCSTLLEVCFIAHSPDEITHSASAIKMCTQFVQNCGGFFVNCLVLYFDDSSLMFAKVFLK